MTTPMSGGQQYGATEGTDRYQGSNSDGTTVTSNPSPRPRQSVSTKRTVTRTAPESVYTSSNEYDVTLTVTHDIEQATSGGQADTLRQQIEELEGLLDRRDEQRITEAAKLLNDETAQFMLEHIIASGGISAAELEEGLRPRGWFLILSLVDAGILSLDGGMLKATKYGLEWSAAISESRKASQA